MNNNHKGKVTLIALILAVIVSVFLFVLREISPLVLIAYGFILLGIAGLWLSNIYFINSAKDYPWITVFPETALIYLAVEAVFSIVAVLLEQFSIYQFSRNWFIVIHVVILAAFLIWVIVLKGGKDVIDQRDDVKVKRMFLQSQIADLAAILDNMPEAAHELKPVMEALRYSDPMSHASLLPCEDKIQGSVAQLKSASEKKNMEEIASLCAALISQIKDRNNRVKIMK